MKKFIYLIVIVVLIQFIPYGKEHNNPKVVNEVKWDSIQTKELFNKACADCHSNNTVWPWYSNIAPISWLVQHDVDEGREHFNVSMWNAQKKNEGEDASEELEDGEMPMAIYTLLHKKARLSKEQKEKLIDGLEKTFKKGE